MKNCFFKQEKYRKPFLDELVRQYGVPSEVSEIRYITTKEMYSDADVLHHAQNAVMRAHVEPMQRYRQVPISVYSTAFIADETKTLEGFISCLYDHEVSSK